MGKNKKNAVVRFINWIESPALGKHAGKITLGIFGCMIFSVILILKIGTVDGNATSINSSDDGINTVRMSSIKYVFTYDDTVDSEVQEAIENYLYYATDSVKLLHMVNMRQQVVFTNTVTEVLITTQKVDGNESTIIKIPTTISSNSLWDVLEELP